MQKKPERKKEQGQALPRAARSLLRLLFYRRYPTPIPKAAEASRETVAGVVIFAETSKTRFCRDRIRKIMKRGDTMQIIFIDSEHEQLYSNLCRRMQQQDEYHRAAAYILSLDRVCREHTEDIFDLQEDVIKPEALCKAWQTSTSRKSCRLLFNLWNGYNSEGEPIEEETPSSNYTPEHIFSCSYAPYYWQAIQLRYPDYTEAASISN